MADETVATLTRLKYSLYGFKAVKTANAGSPLVWFQTNIFGHNTDLSWNEQYKAYTSQTEIREGVTITGTTSYPIELGQTLEVTGDNGTGRVDRKGNPNAIHIHNQTAKRFTSGISQVPSGSKDAAPMCAFDIFGDFTNSMTPVAKVLFLFASTGTNTGTVIFSSYGPGILIDLSGATYRQVNYALDSGWTWGGGTWAEKISTGISIGPKLINDKHQISRRAISQVP